MQFPKRFTNSMLPSSFFHIGFPKWNKTMKKIEVENPWQMPFCWGWEAFSSLQGNGAMVQQVDK